MNSPLNPPETESAQATLRLPGQGSTVSAEDLRVQLVLALDSGGPVTLDASGVESVGQAVLQLLVAARAEALAAGTPFAIASPSAAFTERVERCLLAGAVGLEREGAAA